MRISSSSASYEFCILPDDETSTWAATFCIPLESAFARQTVTTSLSVEMPRGQVSSHHLLPRPARQSSNRGELPIPKTARRTVTTSLSVEMPRGQVSSHHLLPRPARQSSNRGERSLLYSRVVPGGERCTVLRGYLQRKGHTWPGSDEKAFVRDAHGHFRPGVGEVRHGNMNYYYLCCHLANDDIPF